MRKIIKRYGPIVLTIAILAAAVFGIVKLTSIETKTVSPMKFSVGGLSTSEGIYIDNDQSIYTKDLIECRGLTVTPDFDGNVSYQIFWYNMDELYFGCTDIYGNRDKFRESDVPDAARYCRIAIYPSQLDENGKEIDDFKVRFYEPIKYADDVTIKVSKKQTFKPIDLYEIALASSASSDKNVSLNDQYNFYPGKRMYSNGTNNISSFSIDSLSEGYAVVKIDCSAVKEYLITLYASPNDNNLIYFFDKNGDVVGALNGYSYRAMEDTELSIKVPDNAAYMLINLNRYSYDRPETIPVKIIETLPRNEVTEALYSSSK